MTPEENKEDKLSNKSFREGYSSPYESFYKGSNKTYPEENKVLPEENEIRKSNSSEAKKKSSDKASEASKIQKTVSTVTTTLSTTLVATAVVLVTAGVVVNTNFSVTAPSVQVSSISVSDNTIYYQVSVTNKDSVPLKIQAKSGDDYKYADISSSLTYASSFTDLKYGANYTVSIVGTIHNQDKTYYSTKLSTSSYVMKTEFTKLTWDCHCTIDGYAYYQLIYTDDFSYYSNFKIEIMHNGSLFYSEEVPKPYNETHKINVSKWVDKGPYQIKVLVDSSDPNDLYSSSGSDGIQPAQLHSDQSSDTIFYADSSSDTSSYDSSSDDTSSYDNSSTDSNSDYSYDVSNTYDTGSSDTSLEESSSQDSSDISSSQPSSSNTPSSSAPPSSDSSSSSSSSSSISESYVTVVVYTVDVYI